MTDTLSDLVLIAFITLFLSGFVTLWLWNHNIQSGNLKSPITGPLRKAFAILRLTTYGKAPVLCGRHVAELITRKGKMALLDNENCEICTKKSKLI